MKKKTKKIMLLAASVFTFASIISACAKAEGKTRLNEYLGEYEYVYNQEFVDEHDVFVTLDGALDEELWKDQNYLNYSSMGIDLSYTTFFTEKGVYIGAKAVDPNIFYYGRFDMLNNSGFTIYVIAEQNVEKSRHSSYPHPMYRLRLETDSAGDRRSYTQVRFDAGTQVDWEDPSATSGTMVSEFFVSWKALNVDISKGIPDNILIEPVYRKRSLNSSNQVVLKDLYPIFSEPDWPGLYFRFGENGYGNPDVEDCKVGNGSSGLNKTDRWDLSEGTDGKVTSNGRGEEVIFYKGVSADNVFISAKATLIGTSGDFGLIAHTDDKFTYRAFHLSASSLLSGRISLSASRRGNVSPNTGVYQGSGGLYTETTETGETPEVDFSMIKAGTELYFFINGKYVYSEDLGTYLMQKVSPGFYTSNCKVTFSDYKANELSDTEVYDMINAYGAAIIRAPGSVSGGSVTSTYLAVNHGESYDLTIKPNLGYILSSFTINGEDMYCDLYNKLEGTKYTVAESGAAETLEISATFKRISSKRTTLQGTLYSSKESDERIKVAGATIVVKADNCPLLYFRDGSSANGSYFIDYLPVKGTVLTTVNGTEIVCDGKYTISISAYGYNTYEEKIELTESSGNVTKDITLLERKVGGAATLEGKWTYSSNTEGWYLEEEKNGVVEANKGSAYHPLVFTDKIGTRAIIEYTYENKTDASVVGYEKQPGIGFVIKNSSYTLAVILVGKNVRVMPSADWNKSYVKVSDVDFNTSDLFVPTTVRFVHDENMFAVFVKVNENWQLAYKENHNGINAQSAYGLFVTGGGTNMRVVFNDYSIKINEDAEAFIYEQFYKTVTVQDGSEMLIALKGISNGYIRSGNNLQISADRNIIINVNGEKYIYLGKPITITVNENITISSENLGETSTFRGKLNGMESANADRMNYSSTRVTLCSDSVEYNVIGAVLADGSFEIIAPKGNYEAVFDYEYFLDKTISLNAEEKNEVTFDVLRPTESVSTDSFTTSDGSDYEWSETATTVTSAIAKKGVRELKYFSVYGKKYAVKTTIDRLDVSAANGADEYPMAGITLRGANAGYSFLIQGSADIDAINQVRLYFVTTTGDYSTIYIGRGYYVDNKITLGVICDGETIGLYVNKRLVRTILSNTSFETGNTKKIAEGFIGSTVVVGISSIGQKTTFSIFKASAKEDYVDKLTEEIAKFCVSFTQDDKGAPVLVNDQTDTFVKYGEKVTFTISRGRAVLVIEGKLYLLNDGSRMEYVITKDINVEIIRLSEDCSDTGDDIYKEAM